MTDQEENDLLERRRAMPLGERLMTWRDQCGSMLIDKAFQDLGECVAALGAMIPKTPTLPTNGKYGATISFADGVLHINVSGYGNGNGSGHIAFKDNDMEWGSGEDAEWRAIRLARSELEAIRDHLNAWLAASPKDEAGEKRAPGVRG